MSALLSAPVQGCSMVKDAVETPAASAWILTLRPGMHAAVGDLEMVHVMARPPMHDVPFAPAHARRLLQWQGNVVPVVDPGLLLYPGHQAAGGEYVAIFAYTDSNREQVHFGAVPIVSLPWRHVVRDSDAAAPAGLQAPAARIVHSCFQLRGTDVPVLHVPRLFAAPGTASRGIY